MLFWVLCTDNLDAYKKRKKFRQQHISQMLKHKDSIYISGRVESDIGTSSFFIIESEKRSDIINNIVKKNIFYVHKVWKHFEISKFYKVDLGELMMNGDLKIHNSGLTGLEGQKTRAFKNFLDDFPGVWDDDINFMLEQLKPQIGENVLEIGSGGGVMAPHILNKIGVKGHITVIDPAKGQLDPLRNLDSSSVTLIQDTPENISISHDVIFDAIWSRGNFHHITKKTETLKKLRNHSNQNTRLLILDTFGDVSTTKYFDDFVSKASLIGHECAHLNRVFAKSLCLISGWKEPVFRNVKFKWKFSSENEMVKFLYSLHDIAPEYSEQDVLDAVNQYLGYSKEANEVTLNWPMTLMETSPNIDFKERSTIENNKNALLINAHLPYEGFSAGELNSSALKLIEDNLVAKGYNIKKTHIYDGYDINEEIDKHEWASVVICQTPINAFLPPWIYKKYIDSIFHEARVQKRLLINDGRSSSGVPEDYGSGGLMQDKKFMLSTTWNAPALAFQSTGQVIFQGNSVSSFLLPVTSVYKFSGAEILPCFAFYDVIKNPQIESDFSKLQEHLNRYVK